MKKQLFLIVPVLFFLIISTNAQQPAKPAPAKAPAAKPAVTKAPAAKPAVAKAPAKPVEKIYQYVIKGGHVLDFKNNIDGIFDVATTLVVPARQARPAQPARPAANGQPAREAQPAVTAQAPTEGKIALIAKNIDPNLAVQVIDANGLYVTPGFVDLHVHVFWGTDIGGINYRNGPHGIAPDGFTFRSGVTTVLDAGSSGWRDFETFKKQTIDLSETRVLALLNIIGTGMDGRGESNTAEVNAQKAGEMGLKYPDIIVGVKNAHYGQGNTGMANGNLYPIEEGIKAAAMMGGIFMLDGQLSPAVMQRFRPGDIFTHIYGRTMVDSAGNVLPFVLEARKRGIIFDVGFGGSSFTFRQAIPATKHGFWPNSISSDQHISSMNTAMKDMMNIMGLFMAMGMPFKDVIKAATWNPAQEIHRPQLGNLDIGSIADIAIFNVRNGKFGFWGNDGYIDGTKRLEEEITIRAGQIKWNLNGRVKPINLPNPNGRGGGGGATAAGGQRGGARGGQRGGAQPAAPATQPAPR